MNNSEAKEIFQNAIDNATDEDRKAKLEVLREYFTNEDFRKKLQEYTYEQSK